MGRPARVGSGGPTAGATEGPGGAGGPGATGGSGGAGTETAGDPGLVCTGGERGSVAAPGEGFAAEARRSSREAPSSPVAATASGRARSAGEAMGKRWMRPRYRPPPLLQGHARGIRARAARWWPSPSRPTRRAGPAARRSADFKRAGAAPIRRGCGAPRSRRARSRPRRWPPGPPG